MCYLLLKGKKRGKNTITGISGFGFFGSQMTVSWRRAVFQKCFAETSTFFGCPLFGQKGKFWPPTKNSLADNWKKKFIFCFLFCLFLFSFILFYCFLVLLFLEGLRVRWGAQRATSIPPKPSSFVCLFAFFVRFVCFTLFFAFHSKNCFSP